MEEDHRSRQDFSGQSAWKLLKADGIRASLAFLKRHEVSVVLCERDLAPEETWIDILETIRHLPHSPSLIVTSRLADDRLWAEALNLGAWDVLAKPFDPTELLRSVKSAWHHWCAQIQMPAQAMKVMREAS
jgi:DNA-binding response OmpR family regulator